MRRRRFIGAAGAFAAATGVWWAMPRDRGMHSEAPARVPVTQPIRFFIYDERYPDARHVASEQERAGARALATSGEIVTLWREQIADVLRQGSARIAGLTQHSDFEIVRSLASVHRLRVMQQQNRMARVRSGTLTAWLLG